MPGTIYHSASRKGHHPKNHSSWMFQSDRWTGHLSLAWWPANRLAGQPPSYSNTKTGNYAFELAKPPDCDLIPPWYTFEVLRCSKLSLSRGSVVWGAENCCFPWRRRCLEWLDERSKGPLRKSCAVAPWYFANRHPLMHPSTRKNKHIYIWMEICHSTEGWTYSNSHLLESMHIFGLCLSFRWGLERGRCSM